MQHPDRVVVIGAGLGGLRTVESLRRRGFSGQITLLGAERHLPYDRPPLSKQVLRGERDESWLRSLDDMTSLDVNVRLGAPATGLSLDRRTVRTESRSFDYDVAVIATGAVPRRLPGIGGRVLRTLDDAHALRTDLHAGSRLVVIGAGLVGCEVAASARSMGVDVALVDVLPAPAIRVLGVRVGKVLADLHAQRGVELLLGVGVAGFDAGRVTLEDGTVLEADVVLEAVGVVPDTRWLADSGLAVDNGVMCDDSGRAAPGVYAVGDVANWGGHRHEHWTNVGVQADHVAAQILDQEIRPANVSYWWSDQYDVKLQGLGRPAPDDDVDVVTWGPKSRTVAVYSSGGRLTGLVGFSAPGAIMRLRADISAGTDVQDILAQIEERHRMRTYDYVIVGSGAEGGSVLAERLSRDPRVTVLVLEAGGSDRHPLHLVPKGVRFAMSNPKYTKSYRSEPYGTVTGETWYRGRIIGGSTTVNGMVWNRGWAPEYDAWEQAGNKGWNWQRFLAAFKALEDHELGSDATRGADGPVSISIAKPREPVSDTFIETLGKHGVDHVADLNSRGGQRVAYTASNIRRGTRVSAARAYLRKARRRRNVTVLSRTEVERITFDGTAATGVEATRRGRSVRFGARREVLVCGGGLESPMLLERSGIGDPDVLARAGVPLLVASPKVGENMLEHRVFGLTVKLKGRVGYNAQVNSALKQGWTGFKYLFTRKGVISFGGYNIVALFKSDPASEHPDTQGFFTPLSITGSITSGRPVVDAYSGAMLNTYPLYPTSTGSIHITGPNAADAPRIVANFLSTDHDRAITVKMFRKMVDILTTEPFAALVEERVLPPADLQDDDDVLDYALNKGSIGYHGLGTCAMGPNDDDVLDERLRVRGTSNLRVVDASVFPTMPSGNNNAPTQAMAWIAADLILEDVR